MIKVQIVLERHLDLFRRVSVIERVLGEDEDVRDMVQLLQDLPSYTCLRESKKSGGDLLEKMTLASMTRIGRTFPLALPPAIPIT